MTAWSRDLVQKQVDRQMGHLFSRKVFTAVATRPRKGPLDSNPSYLSPVRVQATLFKIRFNIMLRSHLRICV
jgi:hypothetical protein